MWDSGEWRTLEKIGIGVGERDYISSTSGKQPTIFMCMQAQTGSHVRTTGHTTRMRAGKQQDPGLDGIVSTPKHLVITKSSLPPIPT